MTEAADAPTRILEACRHEISERGLRGLRVQDVAKRAGVSLGLVYYHFVDRAGLLRAVLESVNEAALRRSASTGGARGKGLVLGALADEFGDDPEVRSNSVVWNEMRALAVFESDLQPLLAASTRWWNGSIARLLEAAGGGAGAAAKDRAVLLTALVEGLSSRWLSGQIDTREALRLLEAGVRALTAGSADAAGPEETGEPDE